jgi:prepilin-type N-terminal cleavage/methylation domain-containing protein
MPRAALARSQQTSPKAFTLVELLVVIAIIVVLLALLAGGLDRALKAAERSKCGTNQRSIAQAAASYALEYERTFPIWNNMGPTPAVGNANTGFVVRLNVAANSPEATQKGAATGIGHLIVSGRYGGRAGGAGDAIHCPSLDTTSASANHLKMGMNEEGISDGQAANNSKGGSHWNSNQSIVSSYLYRAKSWAATHSASTIRTNIANSTFALTSDTVTRASDTMQYGRTFHHIGGWNVSYGDGHATYVEDPEGPFRGTGAWAAPDAPTWNGFVERKIANGDGAGAGVGNNIHGGAGALAATNADSLATERVFKWFGQPTGSDRSSGGGGGGS